MKKESKRELRLGDLKMYINLIDGFVLNTPYHADYEFWVKKRAQVLQKINNIEQALLKKKLKQEKDV